MAFDKHMFEAKQLDTLPVELTEEQLEQVVGAGAFNIFVGGSHDLKLTGSGIGPGTINVHIHIR